MQRAMWIFVIVSIALQWACYAVVFATQQDGKASPLAWLPLLGAFVVPFAMAFVAHRISGSPQRPFAGLSFGGGGAIVLAWFGAVVVALLGFGIALLLGATSYDPEMNAYIDLVKEQMAASGQKMPEGGPAGALKIGGYFLMGGAPTLSAVVWTGVFALFVYPWYGWLSRRLLAFGRQKASLMLLLIFALHSAPGGMADGPQWSELSIPVRLLVAMAGSLASFPVLWWLFLRYRSAMVPAVFIGTLVSMGQGLMPIMGESSQLLAPPTGLLPSAVVLFAGIALWVMKDPGGMELAVVDAPAATSQPPLYTSPVEQPAQARDA